MKASSGTALANFEFKTLFDKNVRTLTRQVFRRGMCVGKDRAGRRKLQWNSETHGEDMGSSVW